MLNTSNKKYQITASSIVLAILFFVVNLVDLGVNNKFVAITSLILAWIFSIIYLLMIPSVVKKTVLFTVAMFMFTCALVPLYNVFCDVTGINGKVDLTQMAGTPKGIDSARTITVEFVVNHNKQMPWEFRPQHKKMILHPGQIARTAYWAKNLHTKQMVGQAIPSIAPSKASKHFKKMECFCFDSQVLAPKESAHLGLQFYLDPDIPKDVQRITLAYTIFDVTNMSDKLAASHDSTKES